ncbi:MAG: hypothetical protein E6Q97_19250 [Desulfurellales bacterium]|nr:MAG: hypothetical protein E6Q97_19250 [Desulfurellales bacterium]
MSTTYRIISDPSWQVQKKHNGEWVTVYYCKDEIAAAKCRTKCIQRAAAWAKKTPDERMKSILR